MFRDSRRPYAFQLINDPRLTFGTFFLILPDIRANGDESELSGRTQRAAQLCNVILENKKADGAINRIPQDDSVRDALLWIFRTGAADDGLSGDFDQILDISASVLLRKYHRTEILPSMVRLIFRRNRKGTYLHDLVWALFRSREPQAFRLTAEFLRSSSPEDIRLARTLLHLPVGNASDGRLQYASYLHWLEENSSCLCFSSENFNETSRPNACFVNLPAKYLCRHVKPGKNVPNSPLTEAERRCLMNFEKTGGKEQELLADFSRKIRNKNPLYWNRWIRYPIARQIEVAKRGGEGSI